MERIYVVEDDIRLREELRSILVKNGYDCICADRFEQVTEDILKAAPDLVEVSYLPVIVVTSSNSDMDELMSLNVGADDFITKPYNIHILLAHIAAVLQRVHGRKNSLILVHKGLTLDIGKSKASCGEKSVELTKNELGILKLLMDHKGTIVSREELIQELWEMEEFVEDSTLTVNINRLRKKIGDLGLPDYLLTKRGQGYLV